MRKEKPKSPKNLIIKTGVPSKIPQMKLCGSCSRKFRAILNSAVDYQFCFQMGKKKPKTFPPINIGIKK